MFEHVMINSSTFSKWNTLHGVGSYDIRFSYQDSVVYVGQYLFSSCGMYTLVLDRFYNVLVVE